MITALIGLLGVVAGLAIGSGFRFWATRRSELAEAMTGSAMFADALRVLRAQEQSGVETTDAIDRIHELWEQQGRWLLVHMSPTHFEALAASVPGRREREPAPFRLDALIETSDALTSLFWEEHQAFILVPFIHYVSGNTVSKRIAEIVDRETEAVPPRRRGRLERLVKPWHSPQAADAPLIESPSSKPEADDGYTT